MRPLLAGLALLLLFVPACLDFRHIPKNPLSRTLSVENEIEIGSEIHRQIRQTAELVNDPILLDYLNELGQRIVAVTEPQPFVYRFSVIKDDTLNAFAIPGGYIYLHSGVVSQAGDVSELAGVLAHEVAHVRERHIARSRENEGLRSLAALAAIVLSGGDPAVAMIATGINVSIQLKHTREHEAEADRAGIGYLVRAGYDPQGMVHFFERIQTSSPATGGAIPPYLFTHPAVGERIFAARVEIRRTAPPRDLRSEDEQLRGMQARLAQQLAPVAGGTGLLARATFDRSHTDTLLEQARVAVEADDLERASELLVAAQQAGPGDPRVPLARADLAEKREDLAEARVHLQRAFKLDPTVPLVQYRLGLIHKQLGQRSRAVFYLEQAASNFSEGSSGRRRAEFEIDALSFPLLDSSGLGLEPGEPVRERFERGDEIVWWGEVSRRFAARLPAIDVSWRDPAGNVVRSGAPKAESGHLLWSSFDSSSAVAGRWSVRVRAGDSALEERVFQLDERSRER